MDSCCWVGIPSHLFVLAISYGGEVVLMICVIYLLPKDHNCSYCGFYKMASLCYGGSQYTE